MSPPLPLPSAASNRNFEWIVAHFDSLVRQHPNCWIAVDQGHVLAADPDLGVVGRAVADKARPDEVVFHFVDDSSSIFLADAQRAELDARLDAHRRNRTEGSPWPDVKRRLLQRR